MHDFDLFVIGGGSGGVRAARIASGYGARVSIAEEHRLGGTCVIRGCVPKKLMVYASRFRDMFDEAEDFGWRFGSSHFDWQTFADSMHREVARLEGLYRSGLQRSGVLVHDERAAVEGPHTIRLASGRRVTATNILVATGARPSASARFPGDEFAITSDQIFDLTKLPERLLIVGAGYIAVEFAAVFAGLGSTVFMAHRSSKLLRGFDEDIRDDLTAAYQRRGIVMSPDCTVEAIHRDGDKLTVSLSNGGSVTVDQVLLATGRRANTDNLGLEALGIVLNADRSIPVDSYSRTTVASIFAVGDVTNRVNLTPVAIREGHAFADTMFGGRKTSFDHRDIATAVFSTPEIGVMGYTELDARTTGLKVKIFRTRFRPLHSAFGKVEGKVLMKLVVDSASDKVIGIHLLGEGSGELIQTLAIPLTMGATKGDFDRTVAVHPTAAEELVTLRDPVNSNV